MVRLAPSRYKSLGVDVDKKGIEALQAVTDDIFQGAFCSVVKHPTWRGKGIVLHVDGVGSKPIISYLGYRETGETRWFESLSNDAIAMNVDDVICVGARPLAFSDYIALNSFNVDRTELLGGLAKGFARCFEKLRSNGQSILFSGGETADLPDIVRTFDLSGTVYSEVKISEIITGSGVEPGDIIVGMRSGGACSYEEEENSGLMCNGMTLARHSLLEHNFIERYPEIGAKDAKGYNGRFRLDSDPPGLGMTIGDALLSPTRIYLPAVAEVLAAIRPKAMVHNTGGGMTKCRRLGKNILYVKDRLPEPDPVFKLIQRESGTAWAEMYQDFNMGVGFEFIVRSGDEEPVLQAAERFGIGVQVIGHCERSGKGNAVIVKSRMGSYKYGD